MGFLMRGRRKKASPIKESLVRDVWGGRGKEGGEYHPASYTPNQETTTKVVKHKQQILIK